MANKYFCIRRLHYSLVKIHFCKVNKGVCLCIFLRVHVFGACLGTERARGLAQTLLNVPYGEGEGEKLDVYVPTTTSLGVCVCDISCLSTTHPL